MKKVKLLCVVGTRPQILKHSVFITAARANGFECRTVFSGQHWDYKIFGRFLKELEIPKPEYSLSVRDEAYGKRVGRQVDGIMKVLSEYRPDFVVVYGDCDTTLAGALAARRANVKIVHVEAGFRSHDLGMPEEVNRIIVDELSDYLFAPTLSAASELVSEGVRGIVHVTGDILKDLMTIFMEKSRECGILGTLGLIEQGYYYATFHREENTRDKGRIKDILTALGQLDKIVILPLHPRTEKKIKQWGLGSLLNKGNLKVIQPVGYLESLRLQESAKKIITDSGGIQKEAYILGTPCVTIRSSTEYVDTLVGNWNILCYGMAELPMAVAKAPDRAHYAGLFGDGYSVIKMLKLLKENS